MLHLAGHGRHTGENPLFSAVELVDGPWFGYDIDELRRTPATVVLSACELGRVSVRSGEEAIGMSAAWLHAGARTVLSSPVLDRRRRRLRRDGPLARAGRRRRAHPPTRSPRSRATADDVVPMLSFGAGGEPEKQSSARTYQPPQTLLLRGQGGSGRVHRNRGIRMHRRAGSGPTDSQRWSAPSRALWLSELASSGKATGASRLEIREWSSSPGQGQRDRHGGFVTGASAPSSTTGSAAFLNHRVCGPQPPSSVVPLSPRSGAPVAFALT